VNARWRCFGSKEASGFGSVSNRDAGRCNGGRTSREAAAMLSVGERMALSVIGRARVKKSRRVRADLLADDIARAL